MAVFTHTELQSGAKPLDVSEDGKRLKMNRTGTVAFTIDSTKVRIEMEDGKHREYTSSRGVIRAPHGAKVLPYYKHGDEWYLVLVEQFRIALPDKTFEAAGGEVDEKNPRESMARELKEEAGIDVRMPDVQLVYSAYIQPSMMAAKAFGGIVQIERSQLPKEHLAGEWAQNEYTVLVTVNLLAMLNARDTGTIVFDLETCLLLDAVASKVGLIKKLY